MPRVRFARGFNRRRVLSSQHLLRRCDGGVHARLGRLLRRDRALRVERPRVEVLLYRQRMLRHQRRDARIRLPLQALFERAELDAVRALNFVVRVQHIGVLRREGARCRRRREVDFELIILCTLGLPLHARLGERVGKQRARVFCRGEGAVEVRAKRRLLRFTFRQTLAQRARLILPPRA